MTASTIEMIYGPSETIQLKDLRHETIVIEFADPEGYNASRAAAEQWLADHDYFPIPGSENLWEKRITG